MDNLRGIGWMVIAMAGFAIEDMFIKQVSANMPVGEIIVLLGAGGAMIFLLLAYMRGEQVLSRALLSTPVMWRAIGEVIGTIGFVTAIALTPLSSASSILQATPLFVTLGAALFLGETVGWRRWSAILVGFFGVLMILRPGLSGFDPLSLFALMGVIGLAIRDIATRLVPQETSSIVLSVYGFAVLVPTGIAMLLVTDPPIVPSAPDSLRLGIGIIIGVFGYYAITAAMRVGEVAVVTPFRYTRLLFALIIAVLVFGERPDGLTLIGAAIVIGSGLYTLAREARLRPSPASP